ncbi:MAG: hypothetical protein ABL967_14220 [Bryobacteraceae bacterium]
MFEASHKPEGSSNTLTAFLLAVAFVLIPAGMLFLRPLGFLSLVLGVTASAVCVAFAWANGRATTKFAVPPVTSINRKRA